MSVTYTDQIRPAAARVDSEAYVPVYARSGTRKSNKPVKTWMILAPLGVLVVGGAAATILMQPAETTAPAAVEAAPLAPAVAAPEASPLTATIPMETPAELTTATPIPPAAAAPVERRAATPAAPARTARVSPRVAAPAPAEAEAPVSAGPQPYLSVAPQIVPRAALTPVTPPVAAPVTPSATPAPIVITPTT